MGSIPGSGRSPGVGNGNAFQYSCPENPMDKGAWQATVHGVVESNTTKELSGGGLVAKSCPTLATPWAVVTPRTLATPWIFVFSNSKFIGCPVNNLSQLSIIKYLLYYTYYIYQDL